MGISPWHYLYIILTPARAPPQWGDRDRIGYGVGVAHSRLNQLDFLILWFAAAHNDWYAQLRCPAACATHSRVLIGSLSSVNWIIGFDFGCCDQNLHVAYSHISGFHNTTFECFKFSSWVHHSKLVHSLLVLFPSIWLTSGRLLGFAHRACATNLLILRFFLLIWTRKYPFSLGDQTKFFFVFVFLIFPVLLAS